MTTDYVPVEELLTAYADGELNPAGRELVERHLARHPGLEVELERIRTAQEGLRRLLPALALPDGLDPARRASLRNSLGGGRGWRAGRRRLLVLPRLRTIAGLAAAACLVVFVVGLGMTTFGGRQRYAFSRGSGVDDVDCMNEVATLDSDRRDNSVIEPSCAPTAEPDTGLFLGLKATEDEADALQEEREAPSPPASRGDRAARAEAVMKKRKEKMRSHGDTALGAGGGGPGAAAAGETLLPDQLALDAPAEGKTREGRARGREEAMERLAEPDAGRRAEGEPAPGEGGRMGRIGLRSSRRFPEDAAEGGEQRRMRRARSEEEAGSLGMLAEMVGDTQGQRRSQLGRDVVGGKDDKTRRSGDDEEEVDEADDGHLFNRKSWGEPFPGPEVSGREIESARLPAWRMLNRQGAAQARYYGDALPELLAREQRFPPAAHELPAALEPAVRILPLELRPGRFLEEEGQVHLPDGRRTAAAQVLQLARRAGMQVLPAGDRLLIRDPAGPLDPTDGYGLPEDDFKRAFGTKPMVAAAEDARITFAFDDDTASYDRVLMQARRGTDLDGGSVRTEHFVNAMPTGYPAARGPEAFDLYAEAAPSPFAADERTLVVAVGAVARAAGPDERKPLRLTLCIDASGSMARSGGLDRIRPGLLELFARLDSRDRVSVVAFDDRARLLASGLPAARRERLERVVAELRGRGATNAAEGLALAYQVAAETAAPGTASRVLFVTDGATMVGRGAEEVLDRVRRYRGRGITLTIVGCGAEPVAADALERLADAGDGEHRFVGDPAQARELFTTRLIPARLGVLARDAKVQVTWNPERVGHHRLLGYEERRLRHEQFRDDRVDAGELAHATRATALFEVRLRPGGTGPLGRAAVRYYDTRFEEVRELGSELAGGIIRSSPGPRLRLQACAAATAEWLQAGWWSNVRLHSAARILRALRPLRGIGDDDMRGARAELELILTRCRRWFRE